MDLHRYSGLEEYAQKHSGLLSGTTTNFLGSLITRNGTITLLGDRGSVECRRFAASYQSPQQRMGPIDLYTLCFTAGGIA
jgi:hypothetical protein